MAASIHGPLVCSLVLFVAVPGPGYFKNRFGAVYPCHVGTFKSTQGNASCSRCKGRTYAPGAGQKTCSQACPRGCRVNAAHTACITYPPGTQPGPGNARRPCPAGELPLHTDHRDVARPMLRWLGSSACHVRWKEQRGNSNCHAGLRYSAQLSGMR